MATEVVDSPETARFNLLVDYSIVGFAAYQRDADSITFTHTEVDPDQREQGLGGVLVKAALDAVRADTELRVVPQCPFVADWLQENPNYQDLTTR
ncbi:MAG: N-acetyltransferase [Glaciihabitans sp.]|nr:N-acetyltransferase [Glaciihabitans sp.]